jgi:hypothetical protein
VSLFRALGPFLFRLPDFPDNEDNEEYDNAG